jgi:hypothetical protein
MITGEGCTVKCTMQRREGVGVAVSVKLGCGERERGRERERSGALIIGLYFSAVRIGPPKLNGPLKITRQFLAVFPWGVKNKVNFGGLFFATKNKLIGMFCVVSL